MYPIYLKRTGIIGLAIALAAFVVFLGLTKNISNLRSASAQENKANDENTRLKTADTDAYRENMNSKNLSTLLSKEVINFNETKLLPNQIEGSKTMRVSFAPAADTLIENGFSELKPATNSLTQTARRVSNQPLSRQRAFELSTTQILIVSVNQEKQVLWWDLQPDPRIFRAETADDNGVLSGKILYRANAEMLFSIPSAKEITELYFYSPNWNGEKHSLELIGKLDVANREQPE